MAAAPAGPPDGDGKGGGLEAFFAEVGEVKRLMATVRKKLEALQEQHERSKTATRAEDVKETRDSMQADVEAVGRVAHEAKARLEALDEANAAARSARGAGEGTSQDRTRTAVTASLRKKLKDLMGEFQGLRQRFQADYKEQVGRWYYSVTGTDVDDAEIERMIDSGEAEGMFKKEFLEQGRGQILDTVAEIQERHEAIRDMERKLLELHQVFLDMAVLVESQGEMLDNIEAQVAKSVQYVSSGQTALRQAKQLQRSSRKWMCCLIGILLFIVCVIVVAVVGPWASGDA